MKAVLRVSAALAAAAVASGVVAPAAHAQSDFAVTITQEGGPGEQGHLAFGSPTGCPTIFGDTPTPSLTLTKDGQPVTESAPGRYDLGPGSAGVYEVTGTCNYTWSVPKKATSRVTVESVAPTPPPPPPGPDPTDPRHGLTVTEAEFSESSTGRTFSWKVQGCTAPDTAIHVDLLRDGRKVRLPYHSRNGEINASHWPAGTYTLEATCSTDSGDVLTTASQDVHLNQANLSVTYHGEKLFSLIPRPGDRVAINSQPTHNPIPFEDDGTASSFTPGETVIVTATVDTVAEQVAVLTADAHGDISSVVWLPYVADATSFSIQAVGSDSGHILDYTSAVVQPMNQGISVENVPGEPTKLRVTSNQPDGVDIAAFGRNADVKLHLVDQDGNRVPDYEPVAQADASGVIDEVLTLPTLTDGRYTVMAPTPLLAKGYYPAYFYVKDGRAFAQWDEPNIEYATITFDPAGGVWPDGSTGTRDFVEVVGDDFTIINAPERDGYTFLHWEGSTYQPGESFVVPSGGHVFTAVWQQNPVPAQPEPPVQPEPSVQPAAPGKTKPTNLPSAPDKGKPTSLPRTGGTGF